MVGAGVTVAAVVPTVGADTARMGADRLLRVSGRVKARKSERAALLAVLSVPATISDADKERARSITSEPSSRRSDVRMIRTQRRSVSTSLPRWDAAAWRTRSGSCSASPSSVGGRFSSARAAIAATSTAATSAPSARRRPLDAGRSGAMGSASRAGRRRPLGSPGIAPTAHDKM